MSAINYLAYGSNLLPRRLCARIPVLAVLGKVALDDWALDFNKRGGDGSGKCNLRPAPGSIAWGAVYSIAPADKETLDRIEGVGRGYSIDTLSLADFGPCFFYRAETGALDAALRPYDWYHALVLAGARHHAFPAFYVEAIAAVAVLADADVGRRADNLRLLD